MCQILTKEPKIEKISRAKYVYKVVLKKSVSKYKSVLSNFEYELNKEAKSDIIFITSLKNKEIFITDEGLYCFKTPVGAIRLFNKIKYDMSFKYSPVILKCKIPKDSLIIDCNKYVETKFIRYHKEKDVITCRSDTIISNKLIPVSIYKN